MARMVAALWFVATCSVLHLLMLFSIQDAMDALNGRTYDGRDLRITIDAGRPAGGGGGGYRGDDRGGYGGGGGSR